MEAIDRINVRRLTHKLKEDLGSLLDQSFFEPNSKVTSKDVKKTAISYLSSLMKQSAIYDYHVDTKAATWEDYYPDMPSRLLAIEASEKFGDSLDCTPDNIEMVKGYPYRRLDDYWDVESGEYLGSSDNFFEVEEYVRTTSKLVIDNPEFKIFVNMLIQPMEAVSYITIELKSIEAETHD